MDEDKSKPNQPEPPDGEGEAPSRPKKPVEGGKAEKAAAPAKDAARKPRPASEKPAPGEDSGEAEAEPEKAAPAAKPAAKAPAGGASKPPPRRPPQRGPAYEDLEDDPLLAALRSEFGEEAVSGQSFLGQSIYTVDSGVLYDAMLLLRDRWEPRYDYLVDLTALDHLPEEPRFCLVYHLYAYPEGPLIRVKSRIAEGEYAPSVTSIWAAADWMEREVFDMFGIEFSGHPDLKRILLPDDWHGFPLRKDYDIKLQDQAWIRKHLRIRKVPD